MTIGKRIKGARLHAGFGEKQGAEFARKSGVSRQYLNNLEKDRVRKPDPTELSKIALAANVDLEWLITGRGLPNRPGRQTQSEKHLLGIFRELTEKNQSALIGLAESLRDK